MRKKKIMIVGANRSGKTTLAHALNEDTSPVKRTQDIIYGKRTIDIPGSYLESPWMYKHIIAAAQDASEVLFLVDQSSKREMYSPGFANVFLCPVIGVITKSDKAPENETFCISQLKMAGVSEPYFKVCVPDGSGLEALIQHLSKFRR